MHYNLSDNATRSPGNSTGLSLSEADCVDLARKGDGLAFTRLFHQYNAPICTYLARLVGNVELGRDLAQETFLRAWKSLPGQPGVLQFKPWLYRIATNTARSHLRHERLIRWSPWRELSQGTLSSSIWTEGPEAHAGETEEILRVLAHLAPQTRTCLLLQIYAGFSQREIASVLNISEKSVSAYVSRGREQFRQFYRQVKGDAVQ